MIDKTKQDKGNDKMGEAAKQEEISADTQKPSTSVDLDDLMTEDEPFSFSPVVVAFAFKHNIDLIEAAQRLTALDNEPGFVEFVDTVEKILED